MKKILFPVLLFITVNIFAAPIPLDKPGQWLYPDKMTNGTMVFEKFNGYNFNRTSEFILVEPGMEYTIRAQVKTSNGVRCSINFELYDKAKKIISASSVCCRPDTGTTLAVAAAPGDTVITLTDAKKWKNDQYEYVAFETKNDFSDLPNRKVIPVLKISGNTVTLKKPLDCAYPAGTAVRQHFEGSLWLGFGAGAANTDGKWTTLSGKMNGIVSKGKPTPKQFWPGTVSFRIIVHCRSTVPDGNAEIKNIFLDSVSPDEAMFL